MLAHIDHHIQVTRRTALGSCLAFARQANAITGVDAGRYFDRQGLVLFHPAFAMAGVARVGDDLALAMAARAGLLHREEALLHAHLADTAAGRARDRSGAFLGTGTVARLAVDQRRYTNVDCGTAHGLFQVQLQRVAQVAAALCATARDATTATEEIAEDIAEDVGEVGTAETGTATTHARVYAGMAVLVVSCTLARVGENLVGLVGLLEFIFRGLVVRVTVRVVLHREATVGFFQVSLGRAALDTQNLVIVTLCHKSLHS
ncbi:hypothetical protein D9M71_361860 [compost metagenome]